MVGDSKPNDPVAMAEPKHFMEAQAAINSVMDAFPQAPAVFFYETDEVRGINRCENPVDTAVFYPAVPQLRLSCCINRDSRSAKLALSNADLLARDMNKLANFVLAKNPGVMPLVRANLCTLSATKLLRVN